MARPKIMLVEGKEDLHVVASLFRTRADPRLFHIEEQEGFENLRDGIPVYLKASDLRALAIVVDADANTEARWQSVRDVLIAARYQSVPASPARGGTVVQQPGRPTVGVWLMPDNAAVGMLEDFAGFLIPPDDALWPRAREAVAAIPRPERRFAPTANAKAEIYTWLAWQDDPGRSIGTAITLRYLDPTLPHGHAFLDWAARLAAAGDAPIA